MPRLTNKRDVERSEPIYSGQTILFILRYISSALTAKKTSGLQEFRWLSVLSA